MALTPMLNGTTVSIGTNRETAEERQTSRSYRIDFDAGRMAGMIDDIPAMEQAIYKILQTERFAFLIYSWNYGMETSKLIGRSETELRSEAARLISEALTADDRIDAVENLTIRRIDKRTAAVEFTAVTFFGEIPISTEVSI